MKAAQQKKTSVGSQTVERALRLLGCFTNGTPSLKLAELAERIGVPESTTYRYIVALERARILERDTNGGYRLGLHLIELGGLALNQLELHKQSLDVIEWLSEEVKSLVNVGILLDGDVIHIAQSAPRDTPRIFRQIGKRAVAHCTAMGKVMLAHLPWDETKLMIESFGWRPYTDQSITDFDRLACELDMVRRQGFAIDREERRERVACIAVPLKDFSGDVKAAVSVSATPERMDADGQSIILSRLHEAGDMISSRLGFTGN